MVFEIQRENGLLFAVDTVDIKEIGEHETGGTYIIFSDGASVLLEQDYKTVKNSFDYCFERNPDVGFVRLGFTLMSKRRYKELKARVKRVKGQNCV